MTEEEEETSYRYQRGAPPVRDGMSMEHTPCIFGHIEITVPPDIAVESDGDAVMGAFTVHRSKRGPGSIPAPPGSPVLRVTGDAYAAAVTIHVKAPREKNKGQLARNFFGG